MRGSCPGILQARIELYEANMQYRNEKFLQNWDECGMCSLVMPKTRLSKNEWTYWGNVLRGSILPCDQVLRLLVVLHVMVYVLKSRPVLIWRAEPGMRVLAVSTTCKSIQYVVALFPRLQSAKCIVFSSKSSKRTCITYIYCFIPLDPWRRSSNGCWYPMLLPRANLRSKAWRQLVFPIEPKWRRNHWT